MVIYSRSNLICGILAAVCYGINPFGALPLYEEGVNIASVLFYRFFMAVLMLAIMLMVFDESLTFRLAVGNHRNYCSIPHENACILSPIT